MLEKKSFMNKLFSKVMCLRIFFIPLTYRARVLTTRWEICSAKRLSSWGMESEIRDQILDKLVSISLHIIAIGKGINLYSLPPAIGK